MPAETLFPLPKCDYPKPTRKDDKVRRTACIAMAQMMIKEGLAMEEVDLTEWFMGQCKYGYFQNGFELAKEMEDDHIQFEVDANTVMTLDCADSELYSAEARAVEKWIVDCEVKPTFSVGEVIEAEHGRNTIHGAIREVDMRRGYYTVDVGTPNSYPCVSWENARPYTAPARAQAREVEVEGSAPRQPQTDTDGHSDDRHAQTPLTP